MSELLMFHWVLCVCMRFDRSMVTHNNRMTLKWSKKAKSRSISISKYSKLQTSINTSPLITSLEIDFFPYFKYFLLQKHIFTQKNVFFSIFTHIRTYVYVTHTHKNPIFFYLDEWMSHKKWLKMIKNVFHCSLWCI